MRMNIRAIQERLNRDLDAMMAHINSMLPDEDQLRYQRYKNYTKDDWHQFLKGGYHANKR